jgi:hypothetical protein
VLTVFVPERLMEIGPLLRHKCHESNARGGRAPLALGHRNGLAAHGALLVLGALAELPAKEG